MSERDEATSTRAAEGGKGGGGAASTELLPTLLRLSLEVGPLAVFFILNARFDLMAAITGWMISTAVALAVSYALHRRIPILPLVSGAFVLVFGGLSLWLDDAFFIKIKPTVVNTLFGLTLLGGLIAGRNLLRPVLGWAFVLEEAGWHKLARNWGLFFLFLAVLNEIVWRSFSTDAWINFKVFGLMPLTMLFSATQLPIINKYQPKTDEG